MRDSIHADGALLDPSDVCSLPPGPLDDRLTWVRQEILPHALATERLPRGLAIELVDSPGLAQKIDHLIRLERECCSGIGFERRAGAQPGRLRLEIHGVDPDAPVFASLTGTSPQRRGLRLARSVGFGVLASLVVCCVLPLAAGAILGAAAAAPLASLDAPAPIAGGAVLGGVAAWWWQRRRAGEGAATVTASGRACGPDC